MKDQTTKGTPSRGPWSWRDKDKQEHAYVCMLTGYVDEHGYTDEQMDEYHKEIHHQEGTYAYLTLFDNVTELETDFYLYWKEHTHAPFDPFASH